MGRDIVYALLVISARKPKLERGQRKPVSQPSQVKSKGNKKKIRKAKNKPL